MKRHLSFALPLLLLIGPTALLEAHAILLSADPAPNATVHAGPVQVHLRFNARIDARRSRLTLVRRTAVRTGSARISPRLTR
jgi:methionine-rich copper-binding protein CopC